MIKHRLMLSAAATAMLATPAFGACTAPATQPTVITTVGTSPINTCTDGDLQINSAGGVKVTQASPPGAVTVNSNNYLNNGGVITDQKTTGATGILIDASAAPINSTLGTQQGVTDSGTIDLTGTGTGKNALELLGGSYVGSSFIGPITISSSAVTKVTGDQSHAVYISPGSTLQGLLDVNGSITMTPTSGDTAATQSGIIAVDVAGTVKGNVTIGDSGATITGSGAGTEGIELADSGAIQQVAGSSLGTLTNAGTVSLVGNVLSNGQTSSNKTRPETGSALLVLGSVSGGILNSGPVDVSTTNTTSVGVLSSSGLASTGGGAINPVVGIENLGSFAQDITIGPDAQGIITGQGDPSGASFINRGNIIASPLNANASTVAFDVAGFSSAARTVLTAGVYDSGVIQATATSTNASGAPIPAATAMRFESWSILSGSQVTIAVPSNTNASSATNGVVSAVVTGQDGGVASGIDIEPNAVVPTIFVSQYAEVVASVTTTMPDTTVADSANAIRDLSGSLTTINNAGTISAGGTTLTPNAGVTVITNTFNAIDLSTNESGAAIPNAVTINDSGSITGNVLLQGTGPGTALTVGAGNYIGGTAGQETAAQNLVTTLGFANTLNNPAKVNGNVAFGTDQTTLTINEYGSVTGAVTSPTGNLNVFVSNLGDLTLTNGPDTPNVPGGAGLLVSKLEVDGGTIDLTASEELRKANQAVVTAIAGGTATLQPGSKLAISIGTYVPQAATCGVGGCQYVLISAPTGALSIAPADFASYQAAVQTNLQNNLYLFDPAKSGLSYVHGGPGSDELILNLTAKTPQQLGLTGEAQSLFGPASIALLAKDPTTGLVDDQLGSAVVNGITNQTTANQVFSQFAPDVSGDIRAIAISLTDQATGPVAARQRQLRMYANQEGDFTIWGQEFAQFINDKGTTSQPGELVAYKDHGFGFAMGLDSGDPINGWYGGAVTFFAGDATETLPRDAKDQSTWGLVTGYTDWRGHHLFLDTQATIGYGSFHGKRDISIALDGGDFVREAVGKRAGELGALGATTGAVFTWGSLVFMPEISLDGMAMREEGYTETGGGDGMDLKVAPYYADSLRAFLGADMREDLDLGVFTLQPEARLGYRFDFLNDAVKVRAAFAVDPTDTQFSITGPDPTRGNFVAGATLGASTDTWSMGINFDLVRGSNGSETEVGTFSLLGKI